LQTINVGNFFVLLRENVGQNKFWLSPGIATPISY
jgi:hypothetical protein